IEPARVTPRRQLRARERALAKYHAVPTRPIAPPIRKVAFAPTIRHNAAATIGAGQNAKDRTPQYSPTARARISGGKPVEIGAFRAGSPFSRSRFRRKVRTSPASTGSPRRAPGAGSRTSAIGKTEKSRKVVPMNGRGDGDRSPHLATGT